MTLAKTALVALSLSFLSLTMLASAAPAEEPSSGTVHPLACLGRGASCQSSNQCCGNMTCNGRGSPPVYRCGN